jgi:Toxin PAAR-like domain
MSAEVYANGREVSAKKDSNQSLGAMPDVCLSPPPPPAGPVPIPYPNFSKARDTDSGTKSVVIQGKEVGKKSSNYKESKGDIAATRNFGMGVVTHTLEGKMFHAAWSFDVKFEGENAIRHMDLTTHNHGSTPPDTACTTVNNAKMGKLEGDPECVKLEDALREAETNDTKKGRVASGEVVATSKHSKRRRIMKSASESFMKGSCKREARSGYLARPQRERITSGKRRGKTREPTIACTEDRYNGWTCNSGHAEGKAIEDAFANLASPGGSMTLRVRWKDGRKTRDDPCNSCKNAICKTAVECNLKISICVKDGDQLKKQPAPCDSEGRWSSKTSSEW